MGHTCLKVNEKKLFKEFIKTMAAFADADASFMA